MPDREKEGNRIKFRVSPIGINIRILIFAVLVAGTVIFLRPLQVSLARQMEEVRDNFIKAAEEFWGRKIQYGSIGPSIFGTIDIRNVLILREDDSIFLSISRLRFSFSLIELLRGNTKNAFRSARIDKPVLDLDFEKDAGLREYFVPAKGGENLSSIQKNALRDLIPEKFSLKIRNGEWALAGSAGSLMLRGVGLDASLKQSRLSFQGSWNAQASLAGERRLAAFLPSSQVFEVFMTGRFSGEYLEETEEGSATVTIPSVSGDFFRLKPLSVNFFLSGKHLEIRKAYDKAPVAFSLSYDMENGVLRGRFEGEKFSPETMLVFTGTWRDYNSALTIGISGSADFEKDSSGPVRFNINFSGKGPEDSFLKQAFFDLRVSGNSAHVMIDTINILSPFGNLEFRGGMELNPTESIPVAPYGFLALSNFRLNGTQGMSGNLFLSSSGKETNLFSENFTAGNVTFSVLDLSLNWEAEGLTFAFSALRSRETESTAIKYAAPISADSGLGNAESDDIFRVSSMSLTGSADYAPRQIQANLRLDSFSVGDILRLVEPVAHLPAIPPLTRALADDFLLTTDVFFTTDYNHMLYNAPGIVAVYKGFSDILATVSVSGTDRGIDLSSCRISWENGTAEITGSLDYSDTNDMFFSLGVNLGNLTYFFDGAIQSKRNLMIRGSYGFQLYLNSEGNGDYLGHAYGDNIPIPSGKGIASLNFLLSLAYNSPSLWQGAIEKFEIVNLATPASPAARIRFSGAANEKGLHIQNLFFDDGRGALEGKIALNWDPTYEFCGFEADISGINNNEYYDLSGLYKNQKLDLFFSGQGMQFVRFTSKNAVADGSLSLSWESPASFEAEAVISSFALHRHNEVVRISANISMNDQVFLSEHLKINYSGLEASVPYIRIDRAGAIAETEASVWGFFSERPLDISLRGDAAFNESATWLDLFQDFGFLDAALTVAAARYDTIEADEPFVFAFNCSQEREGYALKLSGGPKNMFAFRYTPEAAGKGTVYAALSGTSAVKGMIIGSIDNGAIDAQGTDLYVDLGYLWRFVPTSSPVTFPGGIVTASVKIGGSLEAPEFLGTALGTNLQILIPEFLSEPIQPVPVTVFLNGTEMTFGPVDASAGPGGGKVSGLFRFDQWIPNIFNLDIQVPQYSPIPFDFDISGLLANGLAYGRLILTMENMVLSINGDLTSQDTEISLNFNELAAAEGGRFSKNSTVAVVTDISVRAGRRVEFFWPSVDFPVIQAYADMGTGIHVTSDAVSRRFTLTGDVKLRGGEIFYLERNFYIREGTLFFSENEVQFDPRITARAEIRDQAEIGPVTISMIIDNAPLRSFSPRFVSIPPLSQLEIYSLLGQVPQGEGSQRNLATSVAIDSLAQFTVIGRLQRQVRDFLGLDMFSMRTQLIQNVVMQITGNQPSTVDSPNRVGNYFDNSTIFMGKYFGADLFGEALLSFKYDENKIDWGGLVLEPEIGLEISNPLFDIRFNMAPQHPENLFMDDVSFSLIWRKSGENLSDIFRKAGENIAGFWRNSF